MRPRARAGRVAVRGAWLATALALSALAAGCDAGGGRADHKSGDKPAAAGVEAPVGGAGGNAADPSLNWGGTTPHDTPPLSSDPAPPADQPPAD